TSDSWWTTKFFTKHSGRCRAVRVHRLIMQESDDYGSRSIVLQALIGQFVQTPALHVKFSQLSFDGGQVSPPHLCIESLASIITETVVAVQTACASMFELLQYVSVGQPVTLTDELKMSV